MAFQSVPECAEAVIAAIYGGTYMVNVLGFWKPGGYTQPDLATLAGVVDSVWATDMLPLLNISYHYDAVTVRGLELENDEIAIVTTGSGPGTVAGAGAAGNVAAVVTHRSVFTGRSARGRTFIGGIAQSSLISAIAFDPTFCTNIAGVFTTLKSAAALAGWTFSIISRFHGGAKRTVGTHFDVANSSSRNSLIDSQRGRLATGH